MQKDLNLVRRVFWEFGGKRLLKQVGFFLVDNEIFGNHFKFFRDLCEEMGRGRIPKKVTNKTVICKCLCYV